jgi:hypothetical protein
MTPKERRYFGRRTRGRPGALPLAARTRRGREPTCLPAVRPSLRHLRRVTRTTWRPRSPARSRRKGCTRPSRPVSAGFTVDAPKATLAMRSSYRRGTRPWGLRSSRRWRRFADRRRGKASLRCRKMQPQNSPLRVGRAIYSFSPHTATKQLCLRVGTRRKRSVHSRRLSRRILALTLQLTILPAQ